MKYELHPLEELVSDMITGPEIVATDNAAFLQEVKRTEKAIIHNLLMKKSETQLRAGFTIHVQKLVELTDRIFEVCAFNDPKVTAVLGLLASLKKALPDLVDRNIPLPKAFRVVQGQRLKAEWDKLLPKLQEHIASPELLEIAALPFEEFTSLKIKMSWFHYTWLKQYLHELDHIDFSRFEPYPSAEHLIHECLIRMDFNHSRVTGYCCKVIRDSADRYKDEELLVLDMSKKIVSQLAILSMESFYPKQQSLVRELCRWVDMEIEFRGAYDLAVFAAAGKKIPVNPYKFIYDMTLEQLAFWKKLQLDHKVFIEDNIDTFGIKIAYNTGTKNKDDLSAHSVISKLYSKDTKVISPVYELVVAMIAYLQPTLELLLRMQADLKPFMT
jgi:hypothetical protein